MTLRVCLLAMGYSGGEPETGESQRLAHLDPIPSFRPPSNLRRTRRLPADAPGETDDRYFDVLRRKVARAVYLDSSARKRELVDRLARFDARMRNGMRRRINRAGEIPGGAPGLAVDVTTALPSHTGVYQPFQGY